jgi:hypothetical protein
MIENGQYLESVSPITTSMHYAVYPGFGSDVAEFPKIQIELGLRYLQRSELLGVQLHGDL